MSRAGGGALGGGWSGLSLTGLRRDTWKVGWTLMERGRRRRTAAGLITLVMENGPTNRGASFLDSTFKGKSRVESHTFWPEV